MPYSSTSNASLLPYDARHKLQQRKYFGQSFFRNKDKHPNDIGEQTVIKPGLKRRYDSKFNYKRTLNYPNNDYNKSNNVRYSNFKRFKQHSKEYFQDNFEHNSRFFERHSSKSLDLLGSQSKYRMRLEKSTKKDLFTFPSEFGEDQILMAYYRHMYQQYYKTYTVAAAALSLSKYVLLNNLNNMNYYNM